MAFELQKGLLENFSQVLFCLIRKDSDYLIRRSP